MDSIFQSLYKNTSKFIYLQDYYIFYRFNTNNDGFLSLNELKRMMEVLGAPQTHIGLKQMIKEVRIFEKTFCYLKYTKVLQKDIIEETAIISRG